MNMRALGIILAGLCIASLYACAQTPQASQSVEIHQKTFGKKIQEVKKLLKDNPKLCWMFENCFPNTLETTARYRKVDGDDDTFVYTGDIPAMWLRDSGAQVWPNVRTKARYCSYQRWPGSAST